MVRYLQGPTKSNEKDKFSNIESNIEIHWAVSLSIDGEPKMSLTAKKKFESCVGSGH